MKLNIFLAFLAATSALAGEGSGDGTGSGGGGDKVGEASKSVAPSAPTLTAVPGGSVSSSAAATAASTSVAGGGEEDHAPKSGGEGGGGEGTTPLDAVVLIPVFLVAAAVPLLCLLRAAGERSRERQRRRMARYSAAHDGAAAQSALQVAWQRAKYAPLFTKRHSRGFRPVRWINMGSLPTRMEAWLMMGYFVLNIVFAVATVDWSEEELSLKMYGLRNHSGTLATANLIPLVLTVGRNNPLIPLLGISFDSFNTMHRYLGRLVVVEALLHVGAVLATKVPTSGWSVVPQELWGKELVMYGFISSIMFIVVIIQAWSPLRHALYETFLCVHIALSIGALATLWYHLETLQHQNLLIGVFVAWACERAARIGRIAWWNVGKGGTRATVELLPSNLARVAIRTPRSFQVSPGQHIYLYMPSVGLWTSHPFSIAWVDEAIGSSAAGQVVSLLVKAEKGFTRSLVEKAARSSEGIFSAGALVEGPYGGSKVPLSFDSVLLVAGGVGVTHQLLYIRDLLSQYKLQTSPVKRITLAWAIRYEDQAEWVEPWLRQLLSQHARSVRRQDPLRLRVVIHVSSAPASVVLPPGPASAARSVHRSASSTASATPMLDINQNKSGAESRALKELAQVRLGGALHEAAVVEVVPHRLNAHSLVGREAAKAERRLFVGVCAGGALADEVRDAVRRQLRAGEGEKVVEFEEESFTW